MQSNDFFSEPEHLEIQKTIEEINKDCQKTLQRMEKMSLEIKSFPKVVDDMIKEITNTNSFDSNSQTVLTNSFDSMAASNDEGNKLICKSCTTEEISACLIPCGHLLCNTCTEEKAKIAATECPICKQEVEKVQGVNFV